MASSGKRVVTEVNSPHPEIVSRLKELLREAENKYRRPRDQSQGMVREASRLSDEEFAHIEESPYGSFPCFRETFPPPAPLQIPSDLVTLWRLDGSRIKHVSAMDIETAAPLGGSREMACTIGLAGWSSDSYTLEQLLLRGPDDEMAALWYLEKALHATDLIVTYNGSRFDFPLLEKRYRSVGFRVFEPPCPAVDLEPFARSIFGRQGYPTKLASLEENVLATVRPSWIWHPVWRNGGHLSWRRRRRVARVLAKNAQDVLSLLRLLEVICTAVVSPGERAVKLCLHMGRSLQRQGDTGALEWLLTAVSRGQGTPEGMQAALLAWKSAGDETRETLLGPALEYAALHSVQNAWQAAERLGIEAWKKRDYSQAARWTRCATDLSPPQRVRRTLERRLARYSSKCQQA
jgi:uncharacterized protein YprB with RNaseH-like and TPR domain